MGAKPRFSIRAPVGAQQAPPARKTSIDGTGLTPEMLEQFRQVGIRLDRQGTFWHQGAPITHPRLASALRRWLDVRSEDGRPILRLDDKRYAYVDVEDAFLLIESIRWDDDQPIAVLNDGSEEVLSADTLKVGPGFALYVLARNRALLARLLPRAYYSLAARIEEVGDDFVLRTKSGAYVIGDLPSSRRTAPS